MTSEKQKGLDLGLNLDDVMGRLEGDTNDGVQATSGEDDVEGRETGIHENPVDELLTATGTPAADIPPLTAAEELTLQVKTQFEAACKRGEELLNDTELTLGDRCKSIESISIEIDMLLDKEAIKSDEDLLRKGRDLRSELRLALEHTLLRLCLEPSGATPSTLPEKIEGVADHELERMAHGLNELSLKAVTAKGKESAEKLLEMIEGDKARRAATPRVSVPPPSGERVTGHEATQAVSLTPPPEPPKDEEVSVMIPPPAAIPSTRPDEPGKLDPNQVETQDAPVAQIRMKPKQEEVMQQPPSPPAASPPALPAAPQPSVAQGIPSQVKTQIRVGRDPSPGVNDFIIDNKSVSGRHALLTLMPDGRIRVQDLNSSNGTYVGNQLGSFDYVSDTVIDLGQHMRFGEVQVTTTRDTNQITHLHVFDQQNGKLSPSMIFFSTGDALSEQNRKEQARLDAEAAAAAAKQQPKLKTPEQHEAEKKPKSTTEIQKELKSKSSPLLAILAGLCIVGLVISGIFTYVNWLNDGDTSDPMLATTSSEADAGEVVASTEVDASTASETVAEAETSTPPVPPTGYSCRPGDEVDTCDDVRDFLLSRAEGVAYWDCSGITPEQYRHLYRVEDTSASVRRIIANTCACQYCEPEVHD
jgi:hypothetical protein